MSKCTNRHHDLNVRLGTYCAHCGLNADARKEIPATKTISKPLPAHLVAEFAREERAIARHEARYA